MFLVALVCQSVCLFVDNINQNVMNGLVLIFTGGGGGKGRGPG